MKELNAYQKYIAFQEESQRGALKKDSSKTIPEVIQKIETDYAAKEEVEVKIEEPIAPKKKK